MSKDIQTKEESIQWVYEYTVKWLRTLERKVHELNNSMNECDCEERKVFDFRNISTEEMHVLCISCGGYIQVQDLEDCGMF